MKGIGYTILRDHQITYGTKNVNGTEWHTFNTGFKFEFNKKRIYSYKHQAIEAMEQLKKHYPNDKFEVVEVFANTDILINK